MWSIFHNWHNFDSQ